MGKAVSFLRPDALTPALSHGERETIPYRVIPLSRWEKEQKPHRAIPLSHGERETIPYRAIPLSRWEKAV